MATLTFPNRVESVRRATAFFVENARALGVSAARNPVFEVAVSEALTNAVKHSQAEGHTITCDICVDRGLLTLRIIDGGARFDVSNARLPEISRDHVEAVPERGYGLPIIHAVFPIVRVIEVEGRFGIELAVQADQPTI